MRLRATDQGTIVSAAGDRWVSLDAAIKADGGSTAGLPVATDVLGILESGEEGWAAIASLLENTAGEKSIAAGPEGAGLPFEAKSMRAFMVYEDHVVDSSRMLVKRFFPPPVARAMAGFEKVTGRTFPPLRPNGEFSKRPPFYMGNHRAMLADGEPVAWPSYTDFLDFELELACVISRPIIDATPDEARAAIGGWFVLNDWSARDTQALDARKNPFGPVVKAKTFANSVGADVITADELPDWKAATGRVFVDDELWCEGSTADSAWDIGEMISHASQGELLDSGDVISTGTMPGCCGLEMDRWILPGQTVRMEIDGIGDLTTTVAAGA